MPPNPRNRQEFLRMQEQAMADARDMQRRATLPAPPKQVAGKRTAWEPQPKQETGNRNQGAGERPQSFQPLHHRRPSQQARQNASYGRIRPQINQPPPPPPYQSAWQAPSSQRRHAPQEQTRKKHAPPKNPRGHHEEEPPGMPPLSELFSMFGGLGGLGGLGGSAPEPQAAAFQGVSGESMDSVLMMMLLLLLQKENADQGLMLALMYIML